MSSHTIESDENSATIEVVGDNAREQMKRILEAIEPGLDGDITRMHVEIETDGAEGNENAPPSNGGGGGTIGKMDEVPERGPRSDQGKPKGPLRERDREEGEISPGTSHHVLLDEISEAGEVRAAELNERLGPMPEGTVGSALTILYKRKLIDRESVEDEDHGGEAMQYWITEHGEEVLEEAGAASVDEWAGE